MKQQDIIDAIETAAAEGGSRKLRITGYKTSDGGVINYDVTLLDQSTGYKDLIQASLDKLDTIPFPGNMEQDVLDKAEEARASIKASFEKSLSGGHGRSGPNYVSTGKGWFTSPTDEDAVVLQTMLNDKMEVISGGRSASRNSRPLTIAKSLLRQQLPIEKFLGQLILKADKVESVEVIDAPAG